MAAGSLGAPLLVARAAGELMECAEFGAAPVAVADARRVAIRTAEVKSSLTGLREGRKQAAARASGVLGEAPRLLAPDGQAPPPIQMEGVVCVLGYAGAPGRAPAARDVGGVLTTVVFAPG